MKKVLFIVVLIAGSLAGFSQNMDDIKEMTGKNQFKKAKDAIDKFLGNPKNASNAESFFYKGNIYNRLSHDSTVSPADAMSYKIAAFEAFKKNQELDKLDLYMISENHVSYFDLYNGFFDLGAKAFNLHNYEGAFNGFTNALQVEDYVRSKGYEVNAFKFPLLDTALVLNAAISAKQAKNDDAAITYYRQLADANLSKDNNIDIYLF